MFVAESQEDCVAHMETCAKFQQVHPKDGETNLNGVYDNIGETVDQLGTKQPKRELIDVDSMSVKELRQVISQAGLTMADCIEKSELQARARKAMQQEF